MAWGNTGGLVVGGLRLCAFSLILSMIISVHPLPDWMIINGQYVSRWHENTMAQY